VNTARRKLVCNASKLFDLAILAASLALAAILSVNGTTVASIDRLLSVQLTVRDVALLAGFLVVAHLAYAQLDLYDSRRLSSRRSECADVAKATTIITALLTITALALHMRHVNPTFLAVFWSASTLCSASCRLAVRTLLDAARIRGRNTRNMLMVGTNDRALDFARKIQANPKLGYRIVGFSDTEWHGRKEFATNGRAIVCDLRSLADYVRINVVDEVVLALPVGSFHYFCSRIAAACEEQGIITRFLPDIFNLRTARSRADEFEGDSVITLYTGAGDEWAMMAKRVLDFLLSLLLIGLLSPLLIFVAVIIKLTSPGPVLFTQERLGLHKRRFQIYKFRSMVADAEQRFREVEHLNEVSGPAFKIRNDPRMTSFGRLMRKTSIDELPQLFNVLKGEMSLVGPRPLDVRDYALMTESCANWQRCRFSVRPGITCLWQVNGRSSLSFEKWMELDRQYVHGWSLWLDFKILLRTIPVVLKGTGAA
jgi:exopolysaccharide biosynthesis polyprenyl glycosylphosphotransferase